MMQTSDKHQSAYYIKGQWQTDRIVPPIRQWKSHQRERLLKRMRPIKLNAD